MNIESLKREIVRPSGTYVALRSGITLRLTYPTPIQALGSAIADILEQYMAFIQPDALNTYLAADGTWKKLSLKILNRDLGELRAIPRRYEFVEYHYGHGVSASVGDYGIHFVGSNLGKKRPPLEENLLLLEFPADFLERRSPQAFIDFVFRVTERFPFGSGVAGYSFQHLHMTFRGAAHEAISEFAPRYIGFDIDSDSAARFSRGCVYNVSWLTLLGSALVGNLGGTEAIRSELPASIELIPSKMGLIMKAAEKPMIGDVNHGAEDAAPLRSLAKLTRGFRIAAEDLGPHGDFAERWLSRFDR